MKRSDNARLEVQVANLERQIRSRLLWVTLDFRVVGRGPDDAIVELAQVEDLRLLIDRVTGERLCYHADEVTPDVLEVAAVAEHIPIVYTVTEPQLRLLRDETSRVVAWFGGERGGKTQAMAFACVRQWMLCGGRGVQFLLLSPDLDQTQIYVEKLMIGQDDVGPAFPADLIVRYPRNKVDADQRSIMIDGTELHHRYGLGPRKGGNIKGRGYRAAFIDEICEISDVKVWRVVRGRVNARGGRINQIFIASTPEAGHWAETEIKLRADLDPGGTYRYVHLAIPDNPWVPLREVDELIRDKGGPEDPHCQREVFGRWVAGSARAFYRFDASQHVRSYASLIAAGAVDVTAEVMSRTWHQARGRNPLTGKHEPIALSEVVGQDFNLGLTVSLGLRAVRLGTQTITVACWELTSSGKGTDYHAALLYQTHGARAVSCDPSGAAYGDPRRVGEGRTDRLAMIEAGHDCRPAHVSTDGNPYPLPEIDSLRLVNRMLARGALVIDPSCHELIKAVSNVEADHRGRQLRPRGSDKPSDRQKGYTDALRYPLWHAFSAEMFGWAFDAKPSLGDLAADV